MKKSTQFCEHPDHELAHECKSPSSDDHLDNAESSKATPPPIELLKQPQEAQTETCTAETAEPVRNRMGYVYEYSDTSSSDNDKAHGHDDRQPVARIEAIGKCQLKVSFDYEYSDSSSQDFDVHPRIADVLQAKHEQYGNLKDCDNQHDDVLCRYCWMAKWSKEHRNECLFIPQWIKDGYPKPYGRAKLATYVLLFDDFSLN